VAFPAISAGAYGWPIDDAARIALETVSGARTAVELVRFILFGDAAFAAFTQVAGSYLDATRPKNSTEP
jgi:O-acetyl-ADP-ribose deacetylase (regulator of RNase III)